MPGRRHDGVKAVLQAHPELSSWALATFAGTELPDNFQVVSGAEAYNRLLRDFRGFRADVSRAGGQAQQAICVVIKELGSALAEREFRRCIADAAASWLHRTHAPEGVHVVVFTPDPKADEFPREVALTSGSLTLTLKLCIVGPNQIPQIETVQQVIDNPSVAALSVMAHGHLTGTCERFFQGLEDIEDPTEAKKHVADALELAQGEARSKLKALLNMTTENEVVSEFKRAQQAIGEAKGEARGEARGKALATLQILEHRGLKVSADMWARAEACTDPEQAERWFKRSFDVERAEDLLD
ncbi:hypothetical protein [Actinomadura oligospora]|uniref:hypothetical protein n=1 Tax=Actinomadura oligospora TaxID=111804 RepID=UPI00047AC761|nr:hypothetical protein [Actinomadura oligospora]